MMRWLGILFWLLGAACGFAHIPRESSSARLEGAPGPRKLEAIALHSSGLYTNNTSRWFTNISSGDPVTVTFDSGGFITNVLWRDVSNNIVRTQSRVWDGLGRLLKVRQRDGIGNGYDWSAVYDAFNRRLQTTTITVTNGNRLTDQPTRISQYYDPEVEFLEVGVRVNGQTTWKLHGPDANEVHGGLNGTGGFDAIVPGPHLFCPVLSDARGNLQSVYDPPHGGLLWNPGRPTANGAVPGRKPAPLGFGATLVEASAWRGRWNDIHGGYNLGGNYYGPEQGHFWRPDAYGHVGSPSLYEVGNSDLINYWDSDGRLASKYAAFRGAAQAGLAHGLADFGTGLAPMVDKGLAHLPGGQIYQMAVGGQLTKWGNQAQQWSDGQFGRITDQFSPGQGTVYAAGGFIGELAPNAIPVAGLEKAAGTVLVNAQTAVVRKLPVLGESLGALGRKGGAWLGARLNPANYSTGGRLFMGAPVPKYVGQSSQSLRALTDAAHAKLDPIARDMKSTAIGRYADGSLGIASSDKYVPSVQQQWARENGIAIVNGPGHAEIALRDASDLVRGPLRELEVSRGICLGCEQNVITPGNVRTQTPFTGEPSKH